MFEVVFSHLLKRVSEGALSPDGTVLATASHDGFIKFWQMYIEAGQDKPRLDHSFLPAQHSQMFYFEDGAGVDFGLSLACPGVFMS